ncbi:MAG: c-type cytochrome [Gemmataceae bacterium]|nr:c-type cytochrome [Gemmataceae bacterium]
MRTLLVLWSALLLPVWAGPAAREVAPGLRAPPGFEVVEFADGKLANDIFSLTLDPRGRVVVSGRGYIRTLIDDDGDGRADRAVEFTAGPKDGAQGMLWEGDSLYVTGDRGLRRYRDRDGDGKADGPSELIRAMRTGGEHDAHAIRRGPDGWLYVLCGNMTGVDRSFATLPTSPITDPVAGCVLRFTPDLKGCEIVADGFRNAYGMDFNPDGELFTFDSDNERCVSLPWYEFTRFYHVVPGGRHGWLSPQRASWWRLPPYFPDVVAPVATLGRGSPTGVVCYRHVQFPERFRGGIFLLDWTFGKVHFVPLRREGATYTGTPEVFLESVGDNGFAPTAAAVHPQTGDLFVSVGGRGTRGAVYRIRYTKGVKVDAKAVARLQPTPSRLDWQAGLLKALPAQARSRDALERLRALVGLRRHREHFPGEQIVAAVKANWGHEDSYVRKAAADLIALLPAAEQRALVDQAGTPLQQTTIGLGMAELDPPGTLTRMTRLLMAKDVRLEARRAAVRLVQLALGDLGSPKARGTVWEGYTPRKELAGPKAPVGPLALTRTRAALRTAFPSGDWELDRELARTLAMLEDDDAGTLTRVAQSISDFASPIDNLHYLIVTARLRGPRSQEVTEQVASYLLSLDVEMAAHRLNRDRHWPLRVAELHAELARRDPKFNSALLARPSFGRPDHALFARTPGFDRQRAADIFLKRAARDPAFAWNADVVEVIGTLPPERSLPVLRRLWGKAGLEAALLPLLARDPQPADRSKFLDGLASPDLPTIRLCLEALGKLPGKGDSVEMMALIQALGRLPEGREAKELQAALVARLARITGQSKLGADRGAWVEWFTRAYPELGARLRNPDGVDTAAWDKRLARVDWSKGDAERGRGVFVRASCATCHSGSQALGPDLAGVAGRFARADLFTAMIQPSRDVSPRYRMTVIETTEGKLYQGLVIYEAVDGLILQSGATTTVRLPGDQIASRRTGNTSLMPAGLLDNLSERDLADLYAYLRHLGQPPGR